MRTAAAGAELRLSFCAMAVCIVAAGVRRRNARVREENE